MTDMLISSTQNKNGESKRLDKEIVVIPAWSQGRVSTKGQVEEKTIRNKKVFFKEKASLSEQRAKCRKAISEYRGNCPVCYKPIRLTFEGESFTGGESGREKERRDIKNILQVASNGAFKVLVTIDNDRLARKRATAVQFRDELKELGIQVYSLAQPVPLKCPDCFDPLDDDTGLIVETLSDMKAQLDLNKIRRNYKIGMPKRIKEGKPTGSLPYGLNKTYKKVDTDAKGNDVMEEVYRWDDEKVSILKRITKEYLSGKGVWKISQGLNKDGIPSSQGKKWGRSAILHMLKNPIYAGYIRFGWKPVEKGERQIQPMDEWMLEEAQFDGIWSRDYYEEIQDEIERRSTIGGRAVSSEGLLIGILKCARCKYSMYQGQSGKKLNNGEDYEWRGYVCGTYKSKGTCEHNGIKQEKLDSIVINEVLKLADETTRKEFIKELTESTEVDYEKQLDAKKKRYSQLSGQFDRIKEAYLEGVDELAEYESKKNELVPQIESIKEDIGELEDKIKDPGGLDWEEEYEEVLRRFEKHPSKEEKQKVRTILARLIERVEFRNKPFSVKLFYR